MVISFALRPLRPPWLQGNRTPGTAQAEAAAWTGSMRSMT